MPAQPPCNIVYDDQLSANLISHLSMEVPIRITISALSKMKAVIVIYEFRCPLGMTSKVSDVFLE